MKHFVSRMSSYFPNRWPISYINLTENMKTYIRRQQHKNIKHQDIKQKEPPQKYRLGTISNKKLLAGFYMAITSPSFPRVFTKSPRISLRVIPFLQRYFITAVTSTFSILQVGHNVLSHYYCTKAIKHGQMILLSR